MRVFKTILVWSPLGPPNLGIIAQMARHFNTPQVENISAELLKEKLSELKA